MSSDAPVAVGAGYEPVHTPAMPPVPTPPAAQSQIARARFGWGPVSAEASVEVTPAGLLAVGGMVALVLLSIAPIIRAARTPSSAKD